MVEVDGSDKHLSILRCSNCKKTSKVCILKDRNFSFLGGTFGREIAERRISCGRKIPKRTFVLSIRNFDANLRQPDDADVDHARRREDDRPRGGGIEAVATADNVARRLRQLHRRRFSKRRFV